MVLGGARRGIRGCLDDVDGRDNDAASSTGHPAPASPSESSAAKLGNRGDFRFKQEDLGRFVDGRRRG